MKVLSIVANHFYNINQVQYPKKNCSDISLINPIPFDTVSFTASRASGTPLKKLAEYGMPDMYTGKRMISYGTLSRMLKNGVFDMPLSKLLPILQKYDDTLHKTEQQFLRILKPMAAKQPDIKINDALKQLYPEHQKRLLNIQWPILYKIIMKADKLPKPFSDDVMALMRDTDLKINKDETRTHFSEKEFIYRLQKAANLIKVKKRHNEVAAINMLVHEAKRLFGPQMAEKKKFGRGIAANKLKMDYQMQPENFKRNTESMQYLMDLFDKSCIRNNKDISNIFNITNAKVLGSPIVEPFKRQEFIYNLKNIVKFLKDKNLEMEIIKEARGLPTSAENVSAFIVKHVNDTPEKIGYYLFKGSLCSIEHIEPKVPQVKEEPIVIKVNKKKKGKKKKSASDISVRNNINNYGLSSAYINSMRSNIPFDEWVRKNPDTYWTCQQYVDRLIELHDSGKFKKVGLDKNYIMNFVKRILKNSPAEKPIILDTSRLK